MRNTDTLSQALRPYRVGYLLIDGFSLLSFAASVEPLRATNLLGKRQCYQICYIPASGATAVSSNAVHVPATDALLGSDFDYDLVLVVAGGDPTSFQDKKVFSWLTQLSRRGVVLGGVSGGPAILASAALMNARRMTVHWEHIATLEALYPTLMLERSLYVIDRDRLTCAGGIAPLDMMHALISKQLGANFARRVSDWLIHTDVRPSSDPQRAGLVERYQTTVPSVLDAIEAMENHIGDPLDLSQLAQLTNLSARQLTRLFNAKLGISTMAFYRQLRLHKAKKLLLQSALSITEIALLSGFASSAHFSSCYHNQFSESPTHSRSTRS